MPILDPAHHFTTGARYSPGRYILGLVLLCVLSAGPMLSAALAGEPPEEKLDCRVHATKSGSVTLGLKAGNFLFSVGPEVTFGLASGIAWEKAAQALIARYVEVCNRYNTGMITKDEYGVRIREIDGLYKEAQALEAKLFDATRLRAKAAGNELDRALGKAQSSPPAEAVSLDQSVHNFAERVERLDSVSRPLTPAPPCQPPDMLGAPGRSC